MVILACAKRKVDVATGSSSVSDVSSRDGCPDHKPEFFKHMEKVLPNLVKTF